MLKNVFFSAFRHLRKQKSFALLNLLGLSLGLTCSLLIFLWVQDEVSTDRFHQHINRIYKVLANVQLGDKDVATGNATSYLLENQLESDFAEIKEVVSTTWPLEIQFRQGDDIFKETGIYASSSFFEVFSFSLLKGEASSVLQDPSYGTISVSLAEKLFGKNWQQKEDLLGSIIQIYQDKSFTLTGVFEDVPNNSSMQFEYVLPIKAWIKNRPWDESWGNWNYLQYALLTENVDLEALNKKVAPTQTRNQKYLQNNSSIKVDILLYPFQDMYLKGKFENGKSVGGRIQYVHIFLLIAVMVLLLACINFMNLTTAKSARRAKEIGVRKVVGATRSKLISQFLCESLILTIIAVIIALLLTFLLLPYFNIITNKALILSLLNLTFWGYLIAITLLTALMAGLYPAFFLSSMQAVTIFRGSFKFGQQGMAIRKGLVLFQFLLSLIMIIGTLVIHWQTNYLQNANLGLDKEHTFYVSLEGIKAEQSEIVKHEMLMQDGISQVSFTSQNPLSIFNTTSDPEWEGKSPDDRASFRILDVDEDFFTTMNIPIVNGRAFNPNLSTDTTNYIINEKAARVMGLDEPLSKSLKFWGQEGRIVGVVKDFHLQSLHEDIAPLIIRYRPVESWWVALIKTEAGKNQDAIAGIKKIFQQYKPDYLFEYIFLDDEYQQMYKNEKVIGKLSDAFTFLAITIACLGLIGLSAYAAARRTKEIGIRKVLGASTAQILWLLSQDFMKLILLAITISIPVANYLLSDWLNQYPYRIDLNWLVFAIPGIMIIILTLLVVCGQSLKTANANPVQSLKSE